MYKKVSRAGSEARLMPVTLKGISRGAWRGVERLDSAEPLERGDYRYFRYIIRADY